MLFDRAEQADPTLVGIAGVPERVGFELAVFERVGSDVTVTLYGMSACCDLEVTVFDRPAGYTVSVTGTVAQGRLRPYRITETVSLATGQKIVAAGPAHSERVNAGDLPERVPVVCGADPMLAGLTQDFLHQRDGRYVQMRTTGPARIAATAAG